MAVLANEIPQNNIYTGNDLTSIYTIDQLSSLVINGNYNDLGIGDYITKSITVNNITTKQNFRIVAFNWFVGHGDTPLEQNHLVMIPDGSLCTSYMNDSNTNKGGYASSYMYTTIMPLVKTGLQNCFGSEHILPYRSLLSNSPSAGVSKYSEWYTSYCNLLSTVQVYNSSDIGYSNCQGTTYDQGDGTTQLPLFRLNSSLKISSYNSVWWLSTVHSSLYFIYAYNYGYPCNRNANECYGVRPLFLFY